jgi:serine/threonine protein phosphatase 1
MSKAVPKLRKSVQSPYTYAVGDVHGRLDLVGAAMDSILAHAGKRPFQVILLGDYIDRGPDSRGVIELLIALQRRWSVICLKGNHEALMLQAIEEPDGPRFEQWFELGGDRTLESYGLKPGDDLAGRLPGEHLAWLSELPSIARDQHRIYVHAGLAPGATHQSQDDETRLWIRERFLRGVPGDFEAHIVHGHTPIWAGKPDAGEPELLEHRTNLDTAAFATGVLAVGVFDDGRAGGPLEVLRIRGPSAPLAVRPTASSKRRPRRAAGAWLGRQMGAAFKRRS